MSATVAATPWTLRFSAHRLRNQWFVLDQFRQTARSDFKRIKGFATREQAEKSARTRQRRWVARTAAKSAAARTSTLDELDVLDTLDTFPTDTAADHAAEVAYQREQDAIADCERWWVGQAEEMAAERGDGNDVDAGCEPAWSR